MVTGPATPGVRSASGPRPDARRTKSTRSAWVARTGIPWRPAFPAAREGSSYADPRGAIAAGLRSGPARGGWLRDDRPSIVVVLDWSRPDHVAALRKLEADPRFVAASRVYNCFRVDTRSLPRARLPRPMELRAYDLRGELLGTTGVRSRRSVMRLLDRAFLGVTGRKLSPLLGRLQEQLYEQGRLEEQIRRLQATLVCTRCGSRHASTTKALERAQGRLAAVKRRVEALVRA